MFEKKPRNEEEQERIAKETLAELEKALPIKLKEGYHLYCKKDWHNWDLTEEKGLDKAFHWTNLSAKKS